MGQISSLSNLLAKSAWQGVRNEVSNLFQGNIERVRRIKRYDVKLSSGVLICMVPGPEGLEVGRSVLVGKFPGAISTYIIMGDADSANSGLAGTTASNEILVVKI